ncbi:hypothetical protein CEP51_012428 [Fusarium floridanum]|uniref:Uncharacterized protein n=1 Tax=Fusarium floridanum TaxID=1325733 RepID=A0A428QU69_9HYPO|nr:hypothetical protein CEP51_012428 [Fusarium floridanum]
MATDHARAPAGWTGFGSCSVGFRARATILEPQLKRWYLARYLGYALFAALVAGSFLVEGGSTISSCGLPPSISTSTLPLTTSTPPALVRLATTAKPKCQARPDQKLTLDPNHCLSPITVHTLGVQPCPS